MIYVYLPLVTPLFRTDIGRMSARVGGIRESDSPRTDIEPNSSVTRDALLPFGLVLTNF